MKTLILLILLLLTASSAQILTWKPFFPTVEDTITIVYDATQGNRGLVGANEVYAHTGVITDKSSGPSDWKYVKTAWGQNTPDTRLTPLGNDRWQIRFHIRSYYKLPVGEEVRQLAFVFRSADGRREGKTADGGDIFLPVYKPALQVAVLSPAQTPAFVHSGDSLVIRAAAMQAEAIELRCGDELLSRSTADTLRYVSYANAVGRLSFTVTARNAFDAVSAQFDCHVRRDRIAELPSGARDGISDIENGVRLVLYAPQRSFVYLLGDFNDWQPEQSFLMNRTPDGNRFWIELVDPPNDEEIAFQYLVDGILRLADPYSEKILDSDNDRLISRTTYPGLLPYPTGKTTGMVSVMRPGKPRRERPQVPFRRPPSEQLIIYELLVRDFTREHSFAGVIDKLDYLQQLGVNALELMPITEFEGNSSWGYNPIFYFAPDKYYGPDDDLRRLIDAAHSRGIAVILDVVLNHCYGKSSLVLLYAGLPPSLSWFNAVSPNPVYSWGFDFNHESPDVQAFVDRVLEFWLREYGVDGFRFDFSKGFTNTAGDGWAYDTRRIALLKRTTEQVRSIDPDVYLILEHFTDNREEKELAAAGFLIWGNLNGAFSEAVMGWHDNGKSDFSWGLHTRRGWQAPRVVGYMESHDEERVMVKALRYGNRSGEYDVKNLAAALKRVEAAAAFLLLMPGPKMMWQFGELGYDVSIETNGRVGEKPVRWNYFDVPERRALYDAYAALIRLKKQPGMANPSVKSSLAPSFKWMQLAHDSLNAALAANFDVTVVKKSMGLPKAGKWYDYMTGDSLTIGAVDTVFTFFPGQYRLLLDRKIEQGPSAGIAGKQERQAPTIDVANFPNPFNEGTSIRFDLPETSFVRVTLFDVRGRLTRTLQSGVMPPGRQTLTWDGRDESGVPAAGGVYFCRIEAGELQTVRKMILVK